MSAAKTLPEIRGLARAKQRAALAVVASLAATGGIDDDIRRRAQWLQWGLEGRQPGQEPLPFVDDAGPLAPIDLAGAEAMAEL